MNPGSRSRFVGPVAPYFDEGRGVWCSERSVGSKSSLRPPSVVPQIWVLLRIIPHDSRHDFTVHTGPLICRSSWALKLAIFIKRGCYVKRCFNRGIGRSKISPGRSSFETMGMIFSQLWAQVFGYTEMRLLMLGMDAAGKTSILYKLKLDENVETIPTLGFNVETLWHGNLQLIVWDIGQEQKSIWSKKIIDFSSSWVSGNYELMLLHSFSPNRHFTGCQDWILPLLWFIRSHFRSCLLISGKINKLLFPGVMWDMVRLHDILYMYCIYLL